jgi:hypothetical protein
MKHPWPLKCGLCENWGCRQGGQQRRYGDVSQCSHHGFSIFANVRVRRRARADPLVHASGLSAKALGMRDDAVG